MTDEKNNIDGQTPENNVDQPNNQGSKETPGEKNADSTALFDKNGEIEGVTTPPPGNNPGNNPDNNPDNNNTAANQPAVVTKGSPKNNKGIYAIIVILALALAITAYFAFLKPKPAQFETSAQIKHQQELAQKVNTLESQKKQIQDQNLDALNKYNQNAGDKAIGLNTMNLNPEEKKLIEERIKNEKDVSQKALLSEILDKDKEIKDLNKRIQEIEALLPAPHIVAEGESHYQIGMDFLINTKKVERKRAEELMRRTALFDTIVPGFKVWNFYTGEEYGTSVTQGTAAVSPNTLIRRAKKKLVDARDEAISERDALSQDIKELEKKRDDIINQVELLNSEKKQLIEKNSQLDQQFNTHVNSLYFLLDSNKSLKKRGILKKRFLGSTKLKDVRPEHFNNNIDLRNNAIIPITAEDLGMKKIKEVKIFPKYYKLGEDYKVKIAKNKQTAALTILDAAKFKNERIVIAVW